MPTLVYNCPSGISGDMNLGAMVALGVDPNVLENELRKLPYEGWHLHFDSDQRGGISGLRCTVHLHDDDASHHHYHHHDHSDKHGHQHGHGHPHRSFREIRAAIEASTLSERVKKESVACFLALAEAEGTVHGVASEDVHFHEVGAIDSIVDMVGAAICWELLGVDRIVCGALEVGGGTVNCAHGRMPVPAPATARLLEGRPFSAGATDMETTTPTGAALLAGSGCEFNARTSGRMLRTAIGVGHRDDPNLPNVLYVSLIDEVGGADDSANQDRVWELAANLDDMTGEDIAFLCERLLESGAVDAWQTPAVFKKGRSGVVVQALSPEASLRAVEDCFFKHSSTLGVRRLWWQRTKLERQATTLTTPYGEIRVKTSQSADGTIRQKVEYVDRARLAMKTGLSLNEIDQLIDEREQH